MKNRFLITGLIALMVGACGDDVQIVEPTPPAPPPVTASMAPASATVAVGNSVVFAVNASGGAAGAAATWTCASSNTGIATASTTSAGCQATGVAAGGVTITAAVTKGSETLNVGAQLTVTSEEGPVVSGDPAFIVISSIGTGAEEGIQPAQGWGGRLEVGVNVERGDQTLERVSLLVDGEIVNYQSFGGDMGMTPPEDDAAAAQAVHTFTLTFNTAEYDETTGTPKYMNGDHVLSAELQIAGSMMPDGMMGHETISSNAQTVSFYNADGLHVTADFPGNSAMNPETGELWYGGPDSGDFTIGAVPVTYSGGAAAESVTLLSVCGDDAMTDEEAPYEFTLDCDESGSVSPKFSIAAGGEALLNLAPVNSSIFPLNLDFVGPDAPHFNVNPNGREDGWVNPTVDFLGKFHATRNKDGWLVYNDDEEGVGGYAPQLRFSSTTPSIVDGAREATANALPTAPTKENAVCVIATAVDLLGNESKLPSAGKGCVTAANYVGTEDDDGTTYPAGLRGGLDVSVPTIEFSPASPKEDASSLKEFQVQVADTGASSTGKSGLHSNPVLSKVEARDADNKMLCGDHKDLGVDGGGSESLTGECKLAAEDDEGNYIGVEFNDPLATTDGLSGSETVGYYTFTAVSQDKAGNKSEQIARTAVNDTEAPNVGLIVGGYSKGAFSLTATLTDDLSVKQYWAEAVDEITIDNAADVVILPREGSVAVDDYNSAELTQSYLTSPPATVQVFRALQAAGPGDAPAFIGEIRVVATDHGGRADTASVAGTSFTGEADLDRFGLITNPADNLTVGNFDDADFKLLNYSRDEVFQTFTVVDAESDDDVLELRATILGTKGYTKPVAAVTADLDATPPVVGVTGVDGVEGLVNNPVSRVDFYAAVALKNVSGTDGNNRVPPVPEGGGTEALLFLGSASAAGAEDDSDAGTREYVWGIDMSGADFLELVDGNEDEDYQVVAIAVNSDGVAIYDVSDDIAVEK